MTRHIGHDGEGIGRAMRRAWPLVAAAAILGCADEHFPTESPANGIAAQIVMTSVAHPGGIEHRWEMRVDSATQRFSVRTCDAGRVAAACSLIQVQQEGAVLSSILQRLFEATTTPEFRRLRDSYSRPAGVLPPDGGSASLEVVRNGTRRIITWEAGVTIPLPITQIDCMLRAARGDLILCD